MKNILLVTHNAAEFSSISDELNGGYHVNIIENRISGLEQFQDKRYDLTFVDLVFLKKTKNSSDEVSELSIRALKKLHPNAPIVVLTGQDTIRQAVDFVKEGADDYLTYPIDSAELRLIIDRILIQERKMAELEFLRSQFWDQESLNLVDTKSEKMAEVFSKIKDVAPTKSTAMLTGETGVGKSLLAKLIHKHSERRRAQFIHVHCGAIPDSLIESELFGHEKGAFTGAIKRKLGKFEMANRGTIFLDEVATLTAAAQIKLLQVLQEGSFQRVGGEQDVNVDIRIIAAANEDLEKLCEEGRFRRDLYYRLNVFPIRIPSLRERRTDIPRIANAMIKKLNISHGKSITGIQPEVLNALRLYAWPGNIRELENILERAYIIEKTSFLTAESFPREFFESEADAAVMPLNTDLPLAEARSRIVENFEQEYIKGLLLKTGGKINRTAELAGVGVRQLNKLMNKYGLDKRKFRSFPQKENESEL
jgi:DNA-binding NtrC family response regulator